MQRFRCTGKEQFYRVTFETKTFYVEEPKLIFQFTMAIFGKLFEATTCSTRKSSAQ